MSVILTVPGCEPGTKLAIQLLVMLFSVLDGIDLLGGLG